MQTHSPKKTTLSVNFEAAEVNGILIFANLGGGYAFFLEGMFG